MARCKPKNLHPVKNLKEADLALAQLARLKRDLGRIRDEANEEIDRVKSEAEARAEPLNARLDALENGLLAFAEFNKEELFALRRSRELAFGALGWRRSREIKPTPKGSWKMILARIKEHGFAEALRTREEVNREELHGWPEERLAQVGARRVEKDSFWYEINEQPLRETGELADRPLPWKSA